MSPLCVRTYFDKPVHFRSQVAGCGFRVFADAVKNGGVVKAIAVPDGARLKNSAVKPKGDIFEQAVSAGAQACNRKD